VSRLIARHSVVKVNGSVSAARRDSLAVEEPLEIRVGGTPLTVTMRTPGSDMDLAAGFLVSEGAVLRSTDIATMRYCAGDPGAVGSSRPGNSYNVLDLHLRVPAPQARAFATTSACGVCGSESLAGVRSKAAFDLGASSLRLEADLVKTFPDRLRSCQSLFDQTGGIHAAGLFCVDGSQMCVREDVGRHNAVDKVVGWAVREDRLPLSECVLVVSGRASFELVQKAWLAGIPMLVAVSAPSSLAVDLAREAGMTLVGFARENSMNIYTGAERVIV
jgi:FdhD protein